MTKIKIKHFLYVIVILLVSSLLLFEVLAFSIKDFFKVPAKSIEETQTQKELQKTEPETNPNQKSAEAVPVKKEYEQKVGEPIKSIAEKSTSKDFVKRQTEKTALKQDVSKQAVKSGKIRAKSQAEINQIETMLAVSEGGMTILPTFSDWGRLPADRTNCMQTVDLSEITYSYAKGKIYFNEVEFFDYLNHRSFNNYKVSFRIKSNNSNVGFYIEQPTVGDAFQHPVPYCLNSFEIVFNSYWEATDFFQMLEEAIAKHGKANIGLDFVSWDCHYAANLIILGEVAQLFCSVKEQGLFELIVKV